MRAQWILFILLPAAWSGCLGTGDTTFGIGDEDRQQEEEVSPPIFVLGGCDGVRLDFRIPAAQAREHLPEAFHPAGFVPFITDAHIFTIRCSTMETPTESGSDAWFLWAGIGVMPKHGNWSITHRSMYTTDVFASTSLAEGLRTYGIPAIPADFSHDAHIDDLFAARTWTIQAETASFTIHWAYDARDEWALPMNRWALERHFWVGEDPYLRYDVLETERDTATFGFAPSLLELEGETRFGAIFGEGTLLAPVSYAQWDAEWKIGSEPCVFEVEDYGRGANECEWLFAP